MSTNSKKYLFAIDLDGTVLSNSLTNDIHPITEKAIKRAIQEGHIVTIITGRPWRSTQPTYERLGLRTIVGNYNGAHIHNPKDEYFQQYISHVNLNEMLYILGDKRVKESISNIAFEGPGWVQLDKRDENLERVFGFDTAVKFAVGLDLTKLPLKPTGVIIDIREGVDAARLKRYLDRKFGDLGEFSYWSKGEGLTPVLDIVDVGVKKSKVISLLIRYYDIELKNTISFGDGLNDLSMFRTTHIAVAMANSEEEVKKTSTVISTLRNDEGAVGAYINYFLENAEEEIEKSDKVRKKIIEPTIF
ncbi:Cof-type HAD-IIB family hydrolase [[Mycoplasma] mobile]|uniref:COF family HAD hydrolase protein n=1 Tax=Mycoplasma mobile (strain ATCC 43663 / 163K / NCTC 11711) TaxID=267748 RepID=Q6KIG8_MYCM1|nr:Cof-type HAD-IIB family hydrolase [[Mycoplasma] mobile]AAT27608.1 COF family HAD hydrolase protein [Mycoplasma mobile 163K]